MYKDKQTHKHRRTERDSTKKCNEVKWPRKIDRSVHVCRTCLRTRARVQVTYRENIKK